MSRPVIEEHQEIYHYTTAAGLHGIVTSQQLWATHILYLNDAEEFIGFFDRKLPHLLEEPVNRAVAKVYDSSLNRNFINAEGGVNKVTEHLVCDLMSAIRKTTLSFNQPFVTSFCSAPPGQTMDDGLLSQWRGYGTDGGYAIVFDTGGLQKLLDDEFSRFQYQFGQWGDVYYFDQDENQKAALPEVREWEEIVEKAVEQFILTQKREEFEPLFDAVTALSNMHKHLGFREESEVRIVALPSNAELLEAAQKAGDNRPRKLARFQPRNGILVPYIALFERPASEPAARLPITKVIVGPHPERLKRQKAVELLLEQCEVRAKVVVSDIPYIGR